MFDNNWDLINGEDAHGIEVLNQSSVANLIEALVRYFQHHDTTPGDACSLNPGEYVLRELHRSGTLLLLERPGAYRDLQVQVGRRDGKIYYPPAANDVPAHMEEFERRIGREWKAANAVQIGALSLWLVNWIHPFKNGNGRTARAFAYACICLKHGSMLPGTVTMIDLITQSRERYEDALAHADLTFARDGVADLSPLETYVDGLLREQLLSAISGQADAANDPDQLPLAHSGS
ncbi:Fic family protein [Brevundimonas diminuta]